MKEPTEEQTKEFWEWLGFIYSGECTNPYKQYYGWSYPVKGGGFVDNNADLPPIDLNNLFKYAASRMWICDITLVDAIFWNVKVSCPDVGGFGKHGNGEVLDESLRLAMFWAIWEVKEGS